MADTERSRLEVGKPETANTLNDHLNDSPLDLLALTARELAIFEAGVMHGATVAHDLEHEREEAHAAALHRRAYEVVQTMAKVPPRDAQADAQRAAQRAEWWDERRSA